MWMLGVNLGLLGRTVSALNCWVNFLDPGFISFCPLISQQKYHWITIPSGLAYWRESSSGLLFQRQRVRTIAFPITVCFPLASASLPNCHLSALRPCTKKTHQLQWFIKSLILEIDGWRLKPWAKISSSTHQVCLSVILVKAVESKLIEILRTVS